MKFLKVRIMEDQGRAEWAFLPQLSAALDWLYPITRISSKHLLRGFSTSIFHWFKNIRAFYCIRHYEYQIMPLSGQRTPISNGFGDTRPQDRLAACRLRIKSNLEYGDMDRKKTCRTLVHDVDEIPKERRHSYASGSLFPCQLQGLPAPALQDVPSVAELLVVVADPNGDWSSVRCADRCLRCRGLQRDVVYLGWPI